MDVFFCSFFSLILDSEGNNLYRINVNTVSNETMKSASFIVILIHFLDSILDAFGFKARIKKYAINHLFNWISEKLKYCDLYFSTHM